MQPKSWIFSALLALAFMGWTASKEVWFTESPVPWRQGWLPSWNSDNNTQTCKPYGCPDPTSFS